MLMILKEINSIYWLVVQPTPPKKCEFVSWDYELPNIWKKGKIHAPNHQPDIYHSYIIIPIVDFHIRNNKKTNHHLSSPLIVG